MSEAFNPYAHLKAAASGDVDAMRKYARAGVALAQLDCDLSSIIEGLVFARLAFAASGEDADAGMLISLLALAETVAAATEDVEAVERYRAENVAFISLMADAGNEHCAQFLPGLVDHTTPETAEWAKELHAAMIAD